MYFSTIKQWIESLDPFTTFFDRHCELLFSQQIFHFYHQICLFLYLHHLKSAPNLFRLLYVKRLLLFLWLLSSIILFYFLLRLLSLNFLCWFLSGDFGQRFFFLQFRWRYFIDNGLTYSLIELWQRLIFYLLVSIYELLSCFLLFIFSYLLNLFDPICY